MVGRRISRFGTSSAVLASLLAACSGGSNSSQADSSLAPINPCSVLTRGDIQAVLGAAPTGEGTRENMGVVDKCTWNLPNGASLAVTFYNPSGAAMFYTPQISPRTADDKTNEPVNGLGDQAVYRDNSRPPVITVSETVEVVKGKRHFDVQYVDATPHASPASKGAMLSVARTVLGHAS